MDKPDAWPLSTWDGNRLRQHREFQALPFREKLLRLEQLAALAVRLQGRPDIQPAAEDEPEHDLHQTD